MTQYNSLYAHLTTTRTLEKQHYSENRCSAIDRLELRQAVDNLKLELDGCVQQFKSGIQNYFTFLAAGKVLTNDIRGSALVM